MTVLVEVTIEKIMDAITTEINEDLETEGGVGQSGTIIMGAQTTALITATQAVIISREEALKHPKEWAATSVHEATKVEDDFLEVDYQIKPA
jgi:hypothetical protein